MIKVKRFILYFLMLLVISMFFGGHHIINKLVLGWKWKNLMIHSMLESISGILAVIMAIFIFQSREVKDKEKFYLPAIGLLIIGAFDIFTSTQNETGIIFMRIMSNLIGGIFFSLAWLPKFNLYSSRNSRILYIFAAILILSGIWAIFPSPKILPKMLLNEKFVLFAITTNIFACILFFIGTLRFILNFLYSKDLKDYLFSFIALLFSLSAVEITYITFWKDEWWAWHILRLMIYFFTSGFLIYEYQAKIISLDDALIKYAKTKRELDESEYRFNEIMEKIKLLSIMLDTKGNLTFINDFSLKLLGCKKNEILDKNWFDNFIPVKERDEIKSIFYNNILSGNMPLYYENNIISCSKGETRLVLWNNVILRNHQGEIIGLASIGEDITESKRNIETIKKINQNLKQRTLELELANKEIESFSYSASHDLCAPLRSIDGFSQALLEDYFDKLNETGKDYIQRIHKSVKHMNQLITDICGLSGLMHKEIQFGEVNLSALACKIIEEYKNTQTERNIEFDIEDGLIVKGDLNLFQILLKNLLDNAWKFTAKCQKAKIEFKKLKMEDSLLNMRKYASIFFVRDNGVGFDMKYVDKLFIPFQRLHSTTEFPGSGIGLATARRIINRHNGDIWVDSKEGKGATFYFSI